MTARFIEPMIPRHLQTATLEALKDTPVVLLVGPRQVGKSTLAHHLASQLGVAQTVSLDDPATRASAHADPSGFVAGLGRPAVIDEIQRVPDLLYGIKEAVDRIRLVGEAAAGSFLLTGSASIWDTLRAPESLAGRIERIHMWPFSQGELAGRRERFIDALFDNDPPRVSAAAHSRAEIAQMVVRGGYPEVQNRTETRTQRWFAEYLSRVLDRDIRDLANVRRPEDLLRLLTLCATRAGSLLNVSSMLSDMGIGLSTGRRYYELLGSVYLIHEIPPWGTNLARATARSPKLMIADSGLAAHLLGCSSAKFAGEVNSRPGAGNLFENFVTVELLKASAWCREDVAAFHWRDRAGREVDLLLERRDGSIAAVEHKLGTRVAAEDFRHLAHLRDELGDRFAGGAVIYTGESTLAFGERLWAVPVSGLWM
jgi:predicted AAA+ superfamily ATPase